MESGKLRWKATSGKNTRATSGKNKEEQPVAKISLLYIEGCTIDCSESVDL